MAAAPATMAKPSQSNAPNFGAHSRSAVFQTPQPTVNVYRDGDHCVGGGGLVLCNLCDLFVAEDYRGVKAVGVAGRLWGLFFLGGCLSCCLHCGLQ